MGMIPSCYYFAIARVLLAWVEIPPKGMRSIHLPIVSFESSWTRLLANPHRYDPSDGDAWRGRPQSRLSCACGSSQ
jgi:hypothetical protein